MAGAGDHAGGDESVHGRERRDVLRVADSERCGREERSAWRSSRSIVAVDRADVRRGRVEHGDGVHFHGDRGLHVAPQDLPDRAGGDAGRLDHFSGLFLLQRTQHCRDRRSSLVHSGLRKRSGPAVLRDGVAGLPAGAGGPGNVGGERDYVDLQHPDRVLLPDSHVGGGQCGNVRDSGRVPAAVHDLFRIVRQVVGARRGREA